MRAETHTEVYRRFEGEPARFPLRPWVLAKSGVRVGFRKRLPALLLFAPVAIGTIVAALMVHVKFSAESVTLPGMSREQSQQMSRVLANQLGEVEQIAVQMLDFTRFFSMLAIAWYGCGLIAEDRRLRAHLLWFARPLTRWTYVLGKFGTVAFWGACAVVVPVLVICSMASFSSPDWIFLRERGGTILQLLGFALTWVLVLGSMTLAVSSLVERWYQALAGVVGLLFVSAPLAEALANITGESSWRLLSVWANFDRLAEWMFHVDRGVLAWRVEASFWVLGGLVLASAAVLHRQVGRMEMHA